MIGQAGGSPKSRVAKHRHTGYPLLHRGVGQGDWRSTVKSGKPWVHPEKRASISPFFKTIRRREGRGPVRLNLVGTMLVCFFFLSHARLGCGLHEGNPAGPAALYRSTDHVCAQLGRYCAARKGGGVVGAHPDEWRWL